MAAQREGTQEVSGTEDCYWLLHGQYYDFSEFLKYHPGGIRAISLGKGRDCTVLFESYHTSPPPLHLLERYRIHYAGKDDSPASVTEKEFTFSTEGFYKVLKAKARQYFKDNGYSHTKADSLSILLFVLNLLGILLFAWFGLVKGSILCAFFHGVLRALLIIRPSHAVSHYAFCRNPMLSHLVYCLCLAFVGTSPLQWTAKHVIAHHVNTNIIPMDEDTMYPIKRVLPGLPRRYFHRFQHYYMWFLYPFTMAFWTTSNIVKLYPFFLPQGEIFEGVTKIHFRSASDWIETFGTLGFSIFQRFVLPFLFLDVTTAFLVIGAGEIGCSTWFALQFTVNHEIEACVRHLNEHGTEMQGRKQEDWGVHQVLSSHNYAPDSLWALHLSGGLNLQIEHHLFPSVHFHHYPALAKITKQTCAEFGISYTVSPTFLDALRNHFTLLKRMGHANL